MLSVRLLNSSISPDSAFAKFLKKQKRVGPMMGGTRMANPQLENGHIKIANELADALARVNLSAYESRILWCIIRKTYGWNKKLDRISYTQFEEATGLERRHIARSLRRLIGRRMIVACGNSRKLEYGLQKDYDSWESLPKEATLSLPKEATLSLPKEATASEEGSLPIQAGSLPIQAESLPKEATRSLPKEANTKAIKHNKSIIQKQVYGEFNNVLLTDRDYQLLVKRFTELIAKDWIETLSGGMAANKKYKYDDHRAAILQWERRDRKDKQEGKNGVHKGNTRQIRKHDEYTEPYADR